MLIEVAPGDREWVGFRVEDLDSNETIVSAVWTLPVAPLPVLTNVTSKVIGNEATILVSGFAVGKQYRLICVITTSKSSRIINRFLDIQCIEMTGSALV